MFFPSDIRKILTNLITVPVHAGCNSAWKLDEEYFVHTLLPLVRGTASGEALHRDFIRRAAQGKNIPLAHAVMREFRHKIGGVLLPENRVAKLVDANRVHDVVFKIVRGLHFHHTREILPPNWTCAIELTPPNEPLPDFLVAYVNSGRRQLEGRYRDVFAYVRDIIEDADNLHFWGFQLWGCITITALFHDPECVCEYCRFVGPRLPESLANTRIED